MERQAYRLKLSDIDKMLSVEPNKCGRCLWPVGMLLESGHTSWDPETGKDETYTVDLKWNTIPNEEHMRHYEALEPDQEYLSAVEKKVNDYYEKYSDWSLIVDDKHVVTVDTCMRTFVADLKRCQYEVEEGIFMESTYPERCNLGQGQHKTR